MRDPSVQHAPADVLRDDRFAVGAARMAVAIGGCGRALRAAVARETLAAPVVAATPSGGPV